MDRTTLVAKHAQIITQVAAKKKNYDLRKSQQVDNNLKNKYLEFCHSKGIKSTTFDRRISQNALDMDQQLVNAFNTNTYSVVKNLNQAFSKMQKEIIGKDYDQDGTIEKINQTIDTFFQRSNIELDRLLTSFKVTESKASKIKADIAILSKNLEEQIISDMSTYIIYMDETFLDSIREQYKAYEDEMISQGLHVIRENTNIEKDKIPNTFKDDLKESVKSEEEIASNNTKHFENSYLQDDKEKNSKENIGISDESECI